MLLSILKKLGLLKPNPLEQAELKGPSEYYRVPFTLYSNDGLRAAEVMEFSNGAVYLVEREWDESGYFICRQKISKINRESVADTLVGPFESVDAAERLIVVTDWFNGC